MGLYERILRQEEPKIPVHAFMAAMAEQKRGRVSGAQVASTFQLDAQAQADAITLQARFNDAVNPMTGPELHDVLLLADAGLAYTSVTSLKNRLGVV